MNLGLELLGPACFGCILGITQIATKLKLVIEKVDMSHIVSSVILGWNWCGVSKLVF